jgi:hypothetical protein
MDLQILRGVIECLDQEDSKQEIMISNTAIEPNSLTVFNSEKIRFEVKPNIFRTKKVVKFELDRTYEEYAGSNHEKNRFDVIHAVHSFSSVFR